ncbi:uncharacterized protein LTR77_007802 [Saxophila tyrrhenica]|uniref:2EXR domain-containing protein n=1 Tax=Saxophila tyrrhenica TaxID=1690608 RepID=A0AAV9P304_9PEZI|nr:hypothetical protein LTR77_007802 [Saxophila tyrrhenica]
MPETSTADRTETTTDTTCHLLRLPSELRNRIYHMVIPPEDANSNLLRFQYKTLKPRPLRRTTPCPPALASTCKQIRSELLSERYGRHTFTLWGPHSGHALDRLAGRAKSWLPYVHSIEARIIIRVVGTFWGYLFVKGHLTDTGDILATYQLPTSSPEPTHCTCIFARAARAVNAGSVGSPEDTALVRFFKALHSTR